MGRKSKEEEQRVRSIVLSFIKENVDEDGYLKMSASALSLDRGIPAWSIRTALKNLADDGKVEVAETNDVTDANGRNNRGMLVHLVSNTQPLVVPVKVETPVRKCGKCGTDAPAVGARFCWKCGASLLSEKELLKEAFDRVFPKIARALTDSDANEIMTVIGKVGQLAFKEE